MIYLTWQVKIEHPRELSYGLGKLKGLQLEFGKGGRVGKGGHMANHEHTP